MHTRDNDIHVEHKSIKTTRIELSFIKKKENKRRKEISYILFNICII